MTTSQADFTVTERPQQTQASSMATSLNSTNWTAWTPAVNHSLCPSASFWLSLGTLYLHFTCSQVSPRSHVLMCWLPCLPLSPSQSAVAGSSCSLLQLRAHWVSKATSVLPVAVSVDSCKRLGELSCSPPKRVITPCSSSSPQ